MLIVTISASFFHLTKRLARFAMPKFLEFCQEHSLLYQQFGKPREIESETTKISSTWNISSICYIQRSSITYNSLYTGTNPWWWDSYTTKGSNPKINRKNTEISTIRLRIKSHLPMLCIATNHNHMMIIGLTYKLSGHVFCWYKVAKSEFSPSKISLRST